MEDRKTRPLPSNISHYKQLKDGAYIGHWNIEKGKALKCVISDINQEEVYNTGTHKKEWKNVLHFKGAEKGMILNDTNSDAIASWYGTNPKEWIGKEIELERKTAKLGRETVEAIRVKAKSKSESATASAQ